MALTKSDLDELYELLSSDEASEDTIWEWCLGHGGWLQVLAEVADILWEKS